jgi:hypothetical protein
MGPLRVAEPFGIINIDGGLGTFLTASVAEGTDRTAFSPAIAQPHSVRVGWRRSLVIGIENRPIRDESRRPAFVPAEPRSCRPLAIQPLTLSAAIHVDARGIKRSTVAVTGAVFGFVAAD